MEDEDARGEAQPPFEVVRRHQRQPLRRLRVQPREQREQALSEGRD